MTTLWIVFTILLLTVCGLGLALRSLGRRAASPSVSPRDLAARPSAHRIYRPMGRLFTEWDLAFLKSQPGFQPPMERRFRLQRRLALSLYLRQVRSDFDELWVHCRAAAASSRDPDFGSLVVRQLLVFYGLYSALWIRCWLTSFTYVRIEAGDLVGTLDRLRQRAQQAIGTEDQRQIAAAASR